MSLLKRFGKFIVVWLLVGLMGFIVGGAIVGFQAGRAAGDAGLGYDMGKAAGMAFGINYGLLIWLGALVVAGGVAFRWTGLLLTGGMAVAAYCFFPELAIRPQMASPIVKPAPLLTTVGTQVLLKRPIKVEIAYGSATIPAGTQVEMVEELQYNVRVRVPGGQTTLVSRTNLE